MKGIDATVVDAAGQAVLILFALRLRWRIFVHVLSSSSLWTKPLIVWEEKAAEGERVGEEVEGSVWKTNGQRKTERVSSQVSEGQSI
jgi:hypothetical protein